MRPKEAPWMSGHERRQSLLSLLLAEALVLACESSDESLSGMKPPGDCTPEEHSQLQDAVDTECKRIPSKCISLQSCAVLRANWLQAQQCIHARTTIMNKCFGGGDERHQRARSNVQAGADKCWRYMEEKKCPLPECTP
jgi:putative RNase toxin 16 of polymorphic toxin system